VRITCWAVLGLLVVVAIVVGITSDAHRQQHTPHLQTEQRITRVVPPLSSQSSARAAQRTHHHHAAPLVEPANASVATHEMPAPSAPPAVVESSVPPAPRSPPAVAFLMLSLDGSVSFPDVWRLFFEGAADPAMFSVYIHRSDNGTEQSAAAVQFLDACRGRARAAPYAEGTAWGALINATRMLTMAALADPANVALTVVSATTLPVKNFTHVYDTLVGRGDDSSFCVTSPKNWERSKRNASAVYPKHAQWFTLGRSAAASFASGSRDDPVKEVDEMCGGSWHQCYPTTSEELQMATIVGAVPAHRMGSSWLEAHPPAGGGFDRDRALAVNAENTAGEEFFGGPVQPTLTWPGVNGGHLSLRDVGQKDSGVCDHWHFWDDYPSDAAREPAFEPFQLLASSLGVSDPGEVEAFLEQHVDRFWTPLYHPQVFGPHAMTSAFLLQGLCASKHLFARKFAPEFSLRPQPYARDLTGADIWTCPADAPWRTPAREKLGPRGCGGMRPAPILGLGPAECKELCCAQGKQTCTAWQYRGHHNKLEFCWLGHATQCEQSLDDGSAQWHGETLTGVDYEALAMSNDAAAQHASVLSAFRQCYGAVPEVGHSEGGAMEQVPPAADVIQPVGAAGDAPPLGDVSEEMPTPLDEEDGADIEP
jgi:Core-2/I-Branching enzyme